MIAEVILGYNIDTKLWIKKLKKKIIRNTIFVLDYEYFGEPKETNGVTYISSNDLKIFLKEFDTINFYKSLYGYPGMNGDMSSIVNKKKL
ncbi:hypothetical protein AC739_19135 [Planococcus glaciei]|uniref:hypothetical protein n=1 Tax=Planococcus glaciei TaxID=459472 RepID=UPI00069D2085|nr:hypothetical protein [Planococcus glaciei]KOF08647.1 hypothetical protein AC739_19135 [Planococcus glaciei]